MFTVAFEQLRSLVNNSAMSLLYPMCCRVCNALIDKVEFGIACQRCWQAAENIRLNYDYCEKCDASLPRLRHQTQARPCGHCDELAFEFARSCGDYKGALRESVLWLKTRPQLPHYLKELLLETLHQLPTADQINLLLPVPLHREREKQRSFNQAEIIALVLSEHLGLPVCTTALDRVKATERHRAGMDARARSDSLQNSFMVRASRLIEDRTILLVDDVMTTGATLNEIARTLLENGARAVSALTLARATSHLQ